MGGRRGRLSPGWAPWVCAGGHAPHGAHPGKGSPWEPLCGGVPLMSVLRAASALGLKAACGAHPPGYRAPPPPPPPPTRGAAAAAGAVPTPSGLLCPPAREVRRRRRPQGLGAGGGCRSRGTGGRVAPAGAQTVTPPRCSSRVLGPLGAPLFRCFPCVCVTDSKHHRAKAGSRPHRIGPTPPPRPAAAGRPALPTESWR